MKKEKNLNELQLNNIGVIEKIECDEEVKRRLLDLGLIKGTKIVPILTSPSKDPRAFEIRGSLIAIRKEDAENIKIKRSIGKTPVDRFYIKIKFLFFRPYHISNCLIQIRLILCNR